MSDPVEKPVEEVKEKTEEVVATVTDPVEEVIPDPVEEVTEHPSDEIPPWGQELTQKVESIVEQLGTFVVAPIEPDSPVTPDESPVDIPWTHKPLFGKRD